MPQDGIGDSAQRGIHALNPFSRREQHSREALILYKILTPVSWFILLVTTFYYTFNKPHEGHKPHGRFWQHNYATPFAQSEVITSVYWILLFIFQFGYVLHFYSSEEAYVTAAANVASHFIFSELVLMGFVHLWVRSHFWIALLLLIVNFFNLSFGYFRHPTTPRLVHIAAISGPLAWNFVALYWAGAVAVAAHTLAARIVANIFIWGVLGYGVFFLAAYKDYTMGFALSIMTASTGVGQFLVKHHAVLNLQWIFAFTIMAILFLLSLAVGMPGLVGRDPFPRGAIVSEDRERAPLLSEAEDRA